jgi:hypothetical protein
MASGSRAIGVDDNPTQAEVAHPHRMQTPGRAVAVAGVHPPLPGSRKTEVGRSADSADLFTGADPSGAREAPRGRPPGMLQPGRHITIPAGPDGEPEIPGMGGR